MLVRILAALKSLQQENQILVSAVESMNRRVDLVAGAQPSQGPLGVGNGFPSLYSPISPGPQGISKGPSPLNPRNETEDLQRSSPTSPSRKQGTSRIILTTYPGQPGIDPIIMNWGRGNPDLRGPVVVSRAPSTIRKRNGVFYPHEARRPQRELAGSVCIALTRIVRSYRRAWRFLLHLSCACRGQQ